MIYAIFGIIIGILIGFKTPIEIPPELARYSAIAILGILDSLLGAIRAERQNQFNSTIFVSGLFFNMAIAVAITYLGDVLSLDLYLAAIIVFTLRIFNNLGTIRHLILANVLGKKRVEQELKEKVL